MKVFSNFTRYFFIPYSILPHYLLLLKASHGYDEIEAFPRLNESKRVLYSDAVISFGNHISHLMMINFMITRSPSRLLVSQAPGVWSRSIKARLWRRYSYFLSHSHMQGISAMMLGRKLFAIVRNPQCKRDSLLF